MKPGDIVITTNLQQHLGKYNLVYHKASYDHYMIFIYVGEIKKDALPESILKKVMETLTKLGWKKKKGTKDVQ